MGERYNPGIRSRWKCGNDTILIHLDEQDVVNSIIDVEQVIRWRVLHYGSEHLEQDRREGKEVPGDAGCFVEVEREYSSEEVRQHCEGK
jgi:hypothetical protein